MSEQSEQTKDVGETSAAKSPKPHADIIERFPFCDPEKRHDFVMFFDVRGGNPNGDPDAGNLPRMDPSTRLGVVTDGCTKRKVRDYLARELGRPIFIQSEAALNTLYGRVAKALADGDEEKGIKPDEEVKKAYAEAEFNAEELKKAMTGTGRNAIADIADDQLIEARALLKRLEVEGLDVQPGENPATDIRIAYIGEMSKKPDFVKAMDAAVDDLELQKRPAWTDNLLNAIGDAVARGKGELTKGARDKIKRGMAAQYDDIRLFGAVLTFGTNAGQVRGPMQITFGRSVDPLLPQEAAITRCAITKESDRARKQTEFGRKPWLSYAIYRQHGHFSPAFARSGAGTGADAMDLLRFWVALCKCHDSHRTASSGEQRMQELIVFTHKSARGDAPSHRLLDPINVRRVANQELTGVYDLDFRTVVLRGLGEQGVQPFSIEANQWPKGVTPFRLLDHLDAMTECLDRAR